MCGRCGCDNWTEMNKMIEMPDDISYYPKDHNYCGCPDCICECKFCNKSIAYPEWTHKQSQPPC